MIRTSRPRAAASGPSASTGDSRSRTASVRWWRAERGSVATELTLLTPLLIMLLVLVAVLIHRGVEARLRMDTAAHQAARAASMQRSPASAAHAARSTAARALSDAGVVCQPLRVRTDTTHLAPGGRVTVTLACTVHLTDAAPLDIADQQRLTATASEPIDVYRGVSTRGRP